MAYQPRLIRVDSVLSVVIPSYHVPIHTTLFEERAIMARSITSWLRIYVSFRTTGNK